MNKRLLVNVLLIALLCSGLMIVQSCRKDAGNINTEFNEEEIELLRKAEHYFDGQLKIVASKEKTDINIKEHKPDWSTAKFSKTANGLNYVAVVLYSENNEFIELNVMSEDDEVYGAIKRYLKNSNKLFLYSGSGRIVGSLNYNFYERSIVRDKYGSFKTMDIYGGELNEVPITGSPIGGGDYGWVPTQPSIPSLPSPGGGGSPGSPGSNGTTVVNGVIKDASVSQNQQLDCILTNILYNNTATEKFLIEFKNSTNYNVIFKL